MLNTTNKLQYTLKHVHLYVQLMRNKRLSYTEMAEIGGVSQRTFAEWMRGGCSPAAVEAVLRMLALLPCDQVEKALEVWRPLPPEFNRSSKKDSRKPQRSTAAKNRK